MSVKIDDALETQGGEMAEHARHLVDIANEGEPSQPGEPPRKVTGRLQASIVHEVKADGDDVVLTVRAGAQHAAELEFGTSTIASRPFLRPTLVASLERLRAAVSKAVSRGGR